MDVTLIRAAFIRSQLDRALGDPGSSLAKAVVREFKWYVGVVSDQLPSNDRDVIAGKLYQLELEVAQRKAK
jgi:hypothetical protein